MKTSRQTPVKIGHVIRNSSMAMINWILQASMAITKYSYWFLSVFIFFSCQKNLTQTSELTNSIGQHSEAPVEKTIVIDTARYLAPGRISSLSPSNSPIFNRIHDKMRRFYQANSFKTKWMGENGPTALYFALIDHLKNATHDGLNPETYHVDHIEQQVSALYNNKPATSGDISDVDIRITEIFFLFATHLREGRMTDPGYRGKIWIAHHRQTDHSDVTMLALAKTSPELDEVIKKLQPEHEQYMKLQKLLVLYRSLEKYEIGQLPVPAHQSIKPANRHGAIPAIRKKLWLMEFQVSAGASHGLSASTDSLYYDTAMVSAVKEFQQRRGLEQDGIIGGKTLAGLNQSFRETADLIAVNMERMRWIPQHYAAQCIRVNIPEYKLRIYEQGQRALEMNVIVGAVSSATPVFIDTLEYVVFSPTWTVPASVAKEEFLPRLKRNKMYYAKRNDFTFYKNGVEIDPSTERWDSAVNIHQYRIVQKPGADNALGLAKFIMPNNMNIYLHDTPDHKPFSQRYRALSHGCIRLDDPARLASYLLREEAGWNLPNIKKAMTHGKPTKVILRKQYQVHLEYHTTWVDDQGNLNFGEDIYGHDKRQLQYLTQISSTENLIAVR